MGEAGRVRLLHHGARGGGRHHGLPLDSLLQRMVPQTGVLLLRCLIGCNSSPFLQCIEKTAENAGTHFFKCPLCNNKDEFTAEMLAHGVYVPDRDADWETSNMFADQLQRHDSCDADSCSCPQGRKFDEEDTPWEIMLCVCCGAQVSCIHIY